MVGKIRGIQIKDESVDSVDIASGSIKAGEMHEEAITGLPVLDSIDATNDRILIWDASVSPTGSLKQVAPSAMSGGSSPAGSDTQIQYNNGGAFGGATQLSYDDSNHRLGVGTSAPRTRLDIHHDYHSVAYESQLSAGQGGGKILQYSPGADDTLTVGQLYFLHMDGTWDQTDADSIATGGMQLLGVGLGNARTAGVLLEGFVRVPITEILNTPGGGGVDGLPVYVSTTPGHFDFVAPSGAGDFVRIAGYAIDDVGNSSVLIRFDPDKTWVVVA